MLKISKVLRTPAIAVFCTTLLLLPVKAFAGLVEYALTLVLIAVVVLDLTGGNLPPAAPIVVDQLQTAVEGARAANIVGNSVAELGRLSKAAGAAQALMGMAASCADCGDVRDVLQQIIGQLALLKARIAGVPGACNPNGILVRPEQCDPLATPTGCSTDPIALTYCSDECLCEAVISP